VQSDSQPGVQKDTSRVSQPLPVDLEPHEALLVNLFDGEPLHVDVLIVRSNLGPARVLEILLGLELKCIVTQLPGTHFIRAGDAPPTNR
jgi:predicted Rossmann fold nucleotide-binding protein DprA/Smf involved in DNA uptake